MVLFVFVHLAILATGMATAIALCVSSLAFQTGYLWVLWGIGGVCLILTYVGAALSFRSFVLCRQRLLEANQELAKIRGHLRDNADLYRGAQHLTMVNPKKAAAISLVGAMLGILDSLGRR
jgi:hypothetical protein